MVCTKCSENYVKGGVLFLERKPGANFEFTGRHFVMRVEDYKLMFDDADAKGKMVSVESAEFERLRTYAEKMRNGGKIGKRIVFEKGGQVTITDTFDGSLRIEDMASAPEKGLFGRLLDRIMGK